MFDAVRSATTSAEPAATGVGDDVRIALNLGAALSRGLGGRPTWPLLADTLCDHLPGVDTVSVFLVDDTEEWVIARHVSGAHATHIEHLSIRVGERMSGWVAASGQPMTNADAALDLFDASAVSLRSALAVPCDGPDGHRAVVALYSTQPGAFSALHQRLVEAAVARVSGTTGQIVDLRQDKPRLRRPRSLMSA
jgi:putative methionine-R-sulfoxide reductase with GAF domain